MTRAEKKSVRALADEELLALPILYRGALSSLSVARETSLDHELITYLEGLCARAYFYVYGVRTSAGKRLAAFFRTRLAGGGAKPVARDAGVARFDPDRRARRLSARQRRSRWFDGIVPAGLAGGRDFSASAESLRDTLYHAEGAQGLEHLRHLSLHP